MATNVQRKTVRYSISFKKMVVKEIQEVLNQVLMLGKYSIAGNKIVNQYSSPDHRSSLIIHRS